MGGVLTGLLIAFSGLPGTGKTTLARVLAEDLRATLLRIDVIEQAIRSAGMPAVGPAGYLVGYGLAEANLGPGRVVVADSTNPLRVTRQAWREAAKRAGARHMDVEVICSDLEEHRRRVEARVADIPGLLLPDWAAVQARTDEPWDTPRLVIDTASGSVADGLAAIWAALQHG